MLTVRSVCPCALYTTFWNAVDVSSCLLSPKDGEVEAELQAQVHSLRKQLQQHKSTILVRYGVPTNQVYSC